MIVKFLYDKLGVVVVEFKKLKDRNRIRHMRRNLWAIPIKFKKKKGALVEKTQNYLYMF